MSGEAVAKSTTILASWLASRGRFGVLLIRPIWHPIVAWTNQPLAMSNFKVTHYPPLALSDLGRDAGGVRRISHFRIVAWAVEGIFHGPLNEPLVQPIAETTKKLANRLARWVEKRDASALTSAFPQISASTKPVHPPKKGGRHP